MTLTRKMIFDGQTPGRAWNRHQLAIIDIPWPPPSGWIERAVGRFISERDYEQFKVYGQLKKKKDRLQYASLTGNPTLL
jgi:hypothetical protein